MYVNTIKVHYETFPFFLLVLNSPVSSIMVCLRIYTEKVQYDSPIPIRLSVMILIFTFIQNYLSEFIVTSIYIHGSVAPQVHVINIYFFYLIFC